MILRGVTTQAEEGLRLDEAAPRLFPSLSRGEVRRIIERGGCVVGGSMSRVASRRVKPGEEIVLGVMEAGRFSDFFLTPELVLYEDADYLAVNKPAGINAQRTPYQLCGTMEYAVTRWFRERGIADPARIVHRLDRGTSGVMLFPKSRQAAAHLSTVFASGGVEKRYWALVTGGAPGETWEADGAIGKVGTARYGVTSPGKPARTLFRVLFASERGALLECIPLTGRTHQIRVHLSHRRLPIVGDSTYGGEPAPRMMLHCRAMSFRTPSGSTVSAVADPGHDFLAACLALGVTPP
ncbi:MAG TPA: RluA family pseudouridine synthase [Verrucomicrobiae bacterium]|nr:RluA family pseudouridine synthase [Verrucomicrobiae bacterium]